MDFKAVFLDWAHNSPSMLFIGIRIVYIAIIFEFLAWYVGRRVEKIASPFIAIDGGRDPKWRAMRRAALRQSPKLVLRALLYTVALILVADTFRLQILPLSLAVGSIALLFGAAFMPLMRDYAQGYVLLSEDTLAPGDVVDIDGHIGRVEKWTLRGTWLRDDDGHLHVLGNRDVCDVIILERATSQEPVAFDPLERSAPATATAPKVGKRAVRKTGE